MATRLTYKPPVQKCSCCGAVKPLTEFYRQSYTGAPALQCKECTRIKKNVYRNRQKHNKFVSKEKIRSCGETPTLTLQDWKDAMVWFRGACAFCGRPEGRAKDSKMDRDHLVPLSMGGKAERCNIIPACRKCNRGRGNREWLQWFKAQEFYSIERAQRIAIWQAGEEILNGGD